MEGPSREQNILAETTAPASAGINKRFIKPLSIIIVILAVVFAVFLLISFIAKPYDRTVSTFSKVTVDEDDGLEEISRMLEDQGIVAKASDFRLIARSMFLTELKPGTYYLSPSMDSVSIVRTMSKGITITNGFSIPAGYTMDQIATALEQEGFIDKERFLEAASDPALKDIIFIGKDIKGPSQIEGFLLPGDYHVDPSADEMMLILTMLDGFSNFFNEDYQARADELEMSIRDIIVIASMIENETVIDSEMPEISSVIHNRISLGMTDKNEIPEVPLCSPGEEAILAALYPAETEDTYYVLSSKLDGSHLFTSKKKEYKQLRKEYKQAVKERDEARQSENSEEVSEDD